MLFLGKIPKIRESVSLSVIGDAGATENLWFSSSLRTRQEEVE